MNGVRFAIDHLWQSTLVAAIVALAALALRHRRAGLRYVLWLGASLKFLVPFAALSAIGVAIGSRVALHVPRSAPAILDVVAGAPFVVGTAQRSVAAAVVAHAVSPHATISLTAVLVAIWAAGGAMVLAVWGVRWRRTARLVRAAVVIDGGREVEILRRIERAFRRSGPPEPWRRWSDPPALRLRTTDATIDPGVFGVWRPVLVWPRAMSAHLSDEQIETIFLHELSHVRRRDNLTATAHAVVQALCWFNPIVWWIGARLVDERERACDEAVVSAGRNRQIYAESLLKTCQFCVGAPATTMAGVTGSDLKRRVTGIMTAAPGARLGVVARVALAIVIAAVVAVPVINGAAAVPQVSATLRLPDPSTVFDAASVRQNTEGARSSSSNSGNGNFRVQNMALKLMLLSAFPIQEAQLVGGPDWLNTDRFDVLGKAPLDTPQADLKIMIQNLLIQRFSMKVHIETRSLPIYALVPVRTDGSLGPDMHALPQAPEQQPTNTTFAMRGAGPGGAISGVGPAPVGGVGMTMDAGGPGGRGSRANTMRGGMNVAAFVNLLAGIVKRPVVDRTGLEGRFDIKLRYTLPGSAEGASDPADSAPEIFTAIQEQLGLKLEPTRGPVDVLVIESAAHPKNDDFEMPPQ